MARVDSLSHFLADVASAIKEKKGSTARIAAVDFDTEILALPSQGVYQTKTIRISANGSTIVTPDAGFDAIEGLEIIVNTPVKNLHAKVYKTTSNGTITILPDTGYDGMTQVELTTAVPDPVMQKKVLDVTSNGSYSVNPDENYDGLKSVTVNVDVQSSTDEQHIPLYFIETTDDGDLICVNNYDKVLYVPYSLDEDGNFIVLQDDTDEAIYTINENMELEVAVNG